MFSQDLLQGLKVLYFQNLVCWEGRGEEVLGFLEILLGNMFNISTLHHSGMWPHFSVVLLRPKFFSQQIQFAAHVYRKMHGSFQK